MAIDNVDVVDFVSVNRATDMVALTISDHLDWSDEAAHFAALESKINAYLSFIESGELFSAYPDAEGRKIAIRVVGKYPLPENAERFYIEARRVAAENSVELEF